MAPYCTITDGIYLLKVNNGNTRTRCEICSKLTIKTPERRRWRRSGDSTVSIVNFKHVIAGCDTLEVTYNIALHIIYS